MTGALISRIAMLLNVLAQYGSDGALEELERELKVRAAEALAGRQ